MFIVPLKTLLIQALQATFDDDYPEADFQGLWVSLEFPLDRASYPGIWVDFTSTADLQVAGIGHVEYVVSAEDDSVHQVSRWRYAGMIQFTVVALSGLERDRLVDEVVKVLAFGRHNAARAEFRAMVEDNDLIEVQPQWDRFDLASKGETPGTPWQTDEVVYEQTITLDAQGSFVSDPAADSLVPLSAVLVYETPAGEAEPPGAAGGGWL